VARIDDGERLRERIDRTPDKREPAPSRLPEDRDDEEEAEERIAGMQRLNRRVRIRVDQPRDRDRVVAVRTGWIRRRVVWDPDQPGQQSLPAGGPGRRRGEQQAAQRAGE